ncbi:MAG: hypothetical protein V7782_08495 [Psychromonas sp.]
MIPIALFTLYMLFNVSETEEETQSTLTGEVFRAGNVEYQLHQK